MALTVSQAVWLTGGKYTGDNEMRKTDQLLIVASFCLAVWFLFPIEQIPWANGYGWDGSIYGSMTERLWQVLKTKQVNEYYGCRILPCIAARLLIDLCGQAPTQTNVIFAFRVCNAILAIAGTITWLGIAKQLKLSSHLTITGWMGLFINAFLGKHLSYYPVLTDCYALVFGLLLVRLCLSANLPGLFLVSLAAGFTWPHANTFGAVLIAILPCTAAQEISKSVFRFPVKTFFGLVILCAAVIGFTFVLGSQASVAGLFGIRISRIRQIATHLPNLALWSVAIFELIPKDYVKGCFARLFQLKNLKYFASAALLLIAHKLILNAFINPKLPPPSYLHPWHKILLLGSVSNGQIFSPIVSHVFLAGPLPILAAVIWNRVCQSARTLNGGFVFGIFCCVTSWLQAETRFITLWYPFAITATCIGLSAIKLSSRSRLAFFLFTIYLCGFWRILNPVSLVDNSFRILVPQLPKYWNAAADNYLRIFGGFRGFLWPDFLFYLLVSSIAFLVLKSALQKDMQHSEATQAG